MLARQALAEGPATLAGCAALFSGYSHVHRLRALRLRRTRRRLLDSAAAAARLPRSQSARSVWRRALDGSAALLALVVAGAWLSNAPLGVMASYLLAAVALTVAILQRSWAPILRSAVAVTLGLGLSAIYLVPAAVEQHWVQIRQATDDPGLPSKTAFCSATTPTQISNCTTSNLARLYHRRHHDRPCVLLHLHRVAPRPAPPRSWWIPLALIPVAVLLLQLPISLPLWNLLPKLRFLQFPWRWLVVLEAPLGIFFAAAIWPARGAGCASPSSYRLPRSFFPSPPLRRSFSIRPAMQKMRSPAC